MNLMEQMIGLNLVTVMVYIGSFLLYKRKKVIWLHPVLTSTFLLITFLLFTHVDYSFYEKATEPIWWFLGPLQVAMAIPIYKYFKILKHQLLNILLSVSVGSIAGIVAAVIVGKLFGFGSDVVVSMIPKSATAPIALEASRMMGGVPELTGAFVVFTGIFGMMFGSKILQWVGVKNNLLKGLALGVTAQMVGAARATEWGEQEGAMGTIGMLLTALVIGVFAPVVLKVM